MVKARIIGMFILGGLLAGCTSLSDSQIDRAAEDLSSVYDSECYASYESDYLPDCALTGAGSEFEVYLVGDSHAAHWVPALVPIAEEYGWELNFYGKRSCSFSTNEHHDNRDSDYPSCQAWNENLLEKILVERPDVVVTSNYSRTKVMDGDKVLERGPGSPGEAELAEGMVRTLKLLVDTGIDTVVFQDTPYLGYNTPDCLRENIGSPGACQTPLHEAQSNTPEPELMAAERVTGVEVVNLTSEVCSTDTCYSIKDREIIWRDTHHLTATFAESIHEEVAHILSGTSAFSERMQQELDQQ